MLKRVSSPPALALGLFALLAWAWDRQRRQDEALHAQTRERLS